VREHLRRRDGFSHRPAKGIAAGVSNRPEPEGEFIFGIGCDVTGHENILCYFYLEYAGEKNKHSVLDSIKQNIQPGQRIFLGVTNVLDPRVETPEEIRDLILEAAEIIPVERLGTTDDCGFSPFADDTSTARDIAFAKIKARIDGTRLAETVLSKTSAFV